LLAIYTVILFPKEVVTNGKKGEGDPTMRGEHSLFGNKQ
jgi:hypothetical protein